jgi:hypothetical protein
MYSLRQIGQDLRRVTHGLKALGRYLTSEDHCEAGLGLLSAVSNIVRQGQVSPYTVRIANAGRQPLDCRLTLHIAAATTVEPPLGLYAHLTKSLTIMPRSIQVIAIEYDWQDRAWFRIDDVCSPPDDFRRGGLDRPQLYAVTAVLEDQQGSRLDGLTVYQELTA